MSECSVEDVERGAFFIIFLVLHRCVGSNAQSQNVRDFLCKEIMRLRVGVWEEEGRNRLSIMARGNGCEKKNCLVFGLSLCCRVGVFFVCQNIHAHTTPTTGTTKAD